MDLIAPVGSAAATRPLPLFGDGGMSAGQVVHARVTRVDGDLVQLRWGDQTVSVASKVALTVGQQVNLLVEEGNAGKMLLRMVDDTFGKVRPARTDNPGPSRGGSATGPSQAGRQTPIAGVQGRAERDAGGSSGGQSSWGGEPEWAGTGAANGRPGSLPGQPRTGGSGAFDSEEGPGTPGAPGTGAGVLCSAGQAAARARAASLNPIGPRPATTSGPGGTGSDGAQAARPGPNGATTNGSGGPGWAGQPRSAGFAAGSTWAQGLPVLTRPGPDSDPLSTVLFEALDGSAARLAGTGRTRVSDLPTAATSLRVAVASPPAADGAPADPASAGQEHVARTAMPAYGRLAQSVGGAVAFGQLMAALPQEVGETLARAPLAPADLGRLLIDVGVHPDEMNAVLVGEMLAQGVPVQEGSIRSLRRELAAAGGSPRDAAPAVVLSRLGLPITPLSLAVARQLLAGQLDPPAAWGELLPDLQRLARSAGNGSQAGALAAELLADWQVPVKGGADAISQWLRTTIDQAATPLESKLARPLTTASAEPSTALAQTTATPGQDIRARLDLIGQALPFAGREEPGSLSQALQRIQATVQAEQILNGSSVERTDPRFFAVTLPTFTNHQPGTLQIRVRERDAEPRSRTEAARPDIVHLKLALPGLGDLGVNLTIGQQRVSCHFAAGSRFAEALLNASAGELVDRLKRLGFANPAVDAAQESPEAAAPILAATPRVSHVDLNA